MTLRSEIKVASGVILGDMTSCIRNYINLAAESDQHAKGVYYFGIVASACYLESVLEEFSNDWCKVKALNEQGFQTRLMEHIAKDVSRATGLEAWKKWLRVLYDIDFAKIIGDDWHALEILFQLRNQLAHGRTTKFIHFHNAENGQFIGMTIEGSPYELPFKHLINKDVIRIEAGQVPQFDTIFTRSVVQYFFGVVNRSIAALEKTPVLSSLREGEQAHG